MRQHYGRSAQLHIPEPLIIAIAVLLVGSIAASFVDRLGAPTLLVFLGLGMLLGEDGPGGIQFDNATLARDAGTVALMIILLEGGLLAERSEVVRALGPAGLLATAGVLVTAGVVAVAAHAVVGLGWTTALLLGAAVSSTDAAAVFAALRGTHVRRSVAAVLEAESGLNDPFAALLVIGLVQWSTSDFGTGDGLLLLVRQAGIGALGGLAIGTGGVWLLRRLPLPSAGLAPVITVAIALAGAIGVTALDGSGLLAAYLVGLVIGDARIPHAAVVRGFLQGAAWLAQLGLFVLLGLLVTPSRVLDGGPPRSSSPSYSCSSRDRWQCSCAQPRSGCRCANRASWPGRACAEAFRSCWPRSRSQRVSPERTASSTPSSSWSCSPWQRRD